MQATLSNLSNLRPCKRLLLAGILACQAALMPAVAETPEQRVARILKQTPLVDGHNDIPWAYRKRVKGQLSKLPFDTDLTQAEQPTHTDLARLRQGMVGGQFWSVYVPIATPGGAKGDASLVLEQMDFVYRLVAAFPDDLEIAYTAADVKRIHGAGKIASLMGMEGGHAIENSLGTLRQFYRAGARYMTLTHSKNLDWADSATDEPRLGGLSGFGREVVREMNRLGMLVDLSHVSPDVMHQALDITAAPVMFSHSSAFAVTPHVRNVPDDVLKRIPANGGVVMITFFPAYVSEATRQHWVKRSEARAKIDRRTSRETVRQRLYDEWAEANPAPRPVLSQVADHIDHVRNLIGVDYIGLGGDYDGMPPGPVGLEDVSTYPNLLVELTKRGYSDEDIAAIAGENVLRVMAEAEGVAKRLQANNKASEMLFPAGQNRQDR